MSATSRKTKTNGTNTSPETGTGTRSSAIQARVDAVDWTKVHADLDAQGWAIVPKLLTDAEADSIADLYHQEQGFRSQVIMARHGFGRGEYKYFSYPLPPSDPGAADGGLSPPRADCQPMARTYGQGRALSRMTTRRSSIAAIRRARFVRRRCSSKYAPEDYNCLHRDLYGEHVFPMQIAILLDQPGEDFEGGEFVMTEQRPRMQTRAMVLPLKKGDAAVFAVNSRPMKGVRGDYQVKLNHGVSKLYSGKRHTVGVIFHDAA